MTLHHVYVERKVVPLDIYLRESNPLKSRAAMIDYGRAIKNLAMSDIFPGDMLLKNFGVTRSGRVVFYDYDELTRVTELARMAEKARGMSSFDALTRMRRARPSVIGTKNAVAAVLLMNALTTAEATMTTARSRPVSSLARRNPG